VTTDNEQWEADERVRRLERLARLEVRVDDMCEDSVRARALAESTAKEVRELRTAINGHVRFWKGVSVTVGIVATMFTTVVAASWSFLTNTGKHP